MRTQLRNALKTAFEKTLGKAFDFRTGFAADMNAGGFALPCVWLCPLDLAAKTGRSEGTKTYAATLYLLESSEGLAPEGKDAVWDRLERAAADALADTVAGADEVVAVEKLKALPAVGTCSGYNDISLKVTFEITLRYGCEA